MFQTNGGATQTSQGTVRRGGWCCIMGIGRTAILSASAFSSVVGCSGDFESASTPEDEAPSVEAFANAPASDAKRETERVRVFLDSRYDAKDRRHSFHTKFGETIDCIDFFAQPGVKELAAQGTPITELPAVLPPPDVPAELKDVLFTGTPDDEGQPRACPSNSVPILRVTRQQIRAAGGLDAFMGAHRQKIAPHLLDGGRVAPPPAVDWPSYAHVQQYYTGSDPVIAANATVNIQKPNVVASTNDTWWNGNGSVVHHSIMQVWLQDYRSSALQTIEAGTNVAPHLYGDRNVHFFIYASNDGYATGCYNNLDGKPSTCRPWVGWPGAALTPGMTLSSSTFYGAQAELKIQIYFYRGWNIQNAGTYPGSDFVGPMSGGSASAFSVGGEVFDETRSWYVPMGSGAEPHAIYTQAAYWKGPSDDGLSVIDINGISNTTSFGLPASDHPSEYGYLAYSDGRVYVGSEQKNFYNRNYGYEWSAIGDWAPGSYKAQCNYNAGIPLKGVAASGDGASSEAILCGDYMQAGVANQCYPRSFASGDNRASGYPEDWDPGYVKGECGYMEVASGIAQSASHQLNTILCCPQRNNADHVSCTVEKFESSNSPSYGSGPDWAVGFNKGVCPVGKAVVGISRKSTGAAHAILCCAAT